MSDDTEFDFVDHLPEDIATGRVADLIAKLLIDLLFGWFCKGSFDMD